MSDVQQADAQDRGDTSDAGFTARVERAEALPLVDRADAFAALHDELRTRLESGGTASA